MLVEPTGQTYVDQADVRRELTRTFDVCQSCRQCTDLCGSFPALFELIDQHTDRDAGRLTPADQDRVVDLCHQCKLCAVDCPHGPAIETPGIDVPRLMVRARAMQRANGFVPLRKRVVASIVSRSGMVGTLAAPVAARVASAAPKSLTRRVAHRVTGVSAARVLPPVAKVRFSTWFRTRPAVAIEHPQDAVVVFPSCLVEHNDPSIGHDVVKVLERNNITCSVPAVGCCGAPLLHAGETERFTATAGRMVKRLAGEVRSSHRVVVPQPACHHVLCHDYLEHLEGGPLAADAALVAANTFDAAEYLLQIDRPLDTAFDGVVPDTIVAHVHSHLRVQGLGDAGRDLLRLTGARVDVVERCSGDGGAWGLLAEHADDATLMDQKLSDAIVRTNAEVVAGSCHLANTAIAEHAGRAVQHPVQVIARAYGIEPES